MYAWPARLTLSLTVSLILSLTLSLTSHSPSLTPSSPHPHKVELPACWWRILSRCNSFFTQTEPVVPSTPKHRQHCKLPPLQEQGRRNVHGTRVGKAADKNDVRLWHSAIRHHGLPCWGLLRALRVIAGRRMWECVSNLPSLADQVGAGRTCHPRVSLCRQGLFTRTCRAGRRGAMSDVCAPSGSQLGRSVRVGGVGGPA